MTAPLFHLEPGRLDGCAPGSSVVLDGAEGRHAATVRRIGVGEDVLLADGSGRLVRGVVSTTAKDELTLTVASVEQVAPDQPRLVLVQALAKGDRDDQAIEAATELGVDEVVPWQAARSIVQWKGERGAKAHRKWESVVRAAAKQSRRPVVPVVADLVARDALATRAAAAALVLVLHEDARTPLSDVELPAEGDVLVVVGPEGGIAPDEVDALTAAGGVPVRLGPTVLRSSSAGPAALAVLASRLRW
ncbi:16S rRNA (uracil(1498)-N(3))-methyltransferase [Luteipulveratus sp. YIM 133132]|uniref:16S rRNA (uracil(1498)-N(3))-methyltransferase n=1 Tax=Luteipulveratus flavus TaxID=3031728 RepID=UPI0023B0FD08|nr:16S rRNA (uracil(1498)-N(3))-methyltransferase [Luteipulveratus sp. YIM 133132]MDE9367571.1 16S rRNA (uracil(1498)-N(3))-methyltransferase [Luteipulveratus sp. YIM 133132]